MISVELFEKVKEKYGDVASWAIWENGVEKPKSNMGNMDIFDIQKNPSLLQTLKNNVVMIGLNFSRSFLPTKPFKNFHDSNPHANDFKIRYAFENTQFYGAYMTDVIKNIEMKSVQELRNYLRKNPKIIDDNISSFREEMSCLETEKPILLVFGNCAYDLLNHNLGEHEYSKLIKLTHYSHYISKENYKIKVTNQINSIQKY